MNLTRHIRRHLQTAALRLCLACAAVFLSSGQTFASNVKIGPFTNSIDGGPATNDVILFTVGSTADSDGSYSIQGLPKRLHLAADGSVTNFLMQGNYIFTNKDIGMAIGFGGFPNDAGPTVYKASDWLIPGRFGALNFFVTRVITNGSSASVTFNAVTNALGYVPPIGGVMTNSFDPTNAAATAAAAERAALIATNNQTLTALANGTNATLAGSQATLILSNAVILATATNSTVAERNALIATNSILVAEIVAERSALIATNNQTLTALANGTNATLAGAQAALILSNAVILATATNLTVAERNALIATNSILAASIVAERAALIATNNQTLTALANGTNAALAGAQAALIASNTVILATATNLTVAERNALIATNSILAASIVAERAALIATNNLLLAGGGAFIANNNGAGTNPIIYNALTFTNYPAGTISKPGWKFTPIDSVGNYASWPPITFRIYDTQVGSPVEYMGLFSTNDHAIAGIHAIGLEVEQVWLNALYVGGVLVSNLNGSTASVGAGQQVLVLTNGNAYTVALNPTNVTLQNNVSIGGLTNYLTPSTNVVALWNAGVPAANGNYFRLSSVDLTNMDAAGNGNGSDLFFSNPTWFQRTNQVNLFSSSNLVAGSTWNNVIGSTAVPNSSYGFTNDFKGMIVANFTAPATLVSNITKSVTNGFGTLAYLNNNTTVSNAQTAVAAVTASNFVGKTITNRNNTGITITNPASSSWFSVGTNGQNHADNWYSTSASIDLNSSENFKSGSIYLFNNNGLLGNYMQFSDDGLDISSTNDTASFFQVHPTFFLVQVTTLDGKHPVFQVNENDEISGINGTGAGFNALDDGSMTLLSSNVNFIEAGPDNRNYFSAAGGSNVFIGPMIGNGIGLTNIPWAVSTIGLLASNIAYQNSTNQGAASTNYANSIIGSITKFNVLTNGLIDGYSQELLWTNGIVLRDSSNAVNYAYSFFGFNGSVPLWTNVNSVTGIGRGLWISETGTGQFRLNDITGILFLKNGGSPVGPWSGNLVTTNPPNGDWSRFSNFGDGGNAEGWVFSNLPASSLAGTLPLTILPSAVVTNGDTRATTLANASVKTATNVVSGATFTNVNFWLGNQPITFASTNINDLSTIVFWDQGKGFPGIDILNSNKTAEFSFNAWLDPASPFYGNIVSQANPADRLGVLGYYPTNGFGLIGTYVNFPGQVQIIHPWMYLNPTNGSLDFFAYGASDHYSNPTTWTNPAIHINGTNGVETLATVSPSQFHIAGTFTSDSSTPTTLTVSGGSIVGVVFPGDIVVNTNNNNLGLVRQTNATTMTVVNLSGGVFSISSTGLDLQRASFHSSGLLRTGYGFNIDAAGDPDVYRPSGTSYSFIGCGSGVWAQAVGSTDKNYRIHSFQDNADSLVIKNGAPDSGFQLQVYGPCFRGIFSNDQANAHLTFGVPLWITNATAATIINSNSVTTGTVNATNFVGNGNALTNIPSSSIVASGQSFWITNPIVSGATWTNTTGAAGTLSICYTLNDSAISGDPSIWFTNLDNAAEHFEATNNFALAVNPAEWVTFRVYPNERVISTNKSSGSANTTINNSAFRP